MRVTVRPVVDREAEQVIIECVEVTQDVKDIEAYVLSKGTVLSGVSGERMHTFQLSSVLYFEGVDGRVFAYTKERVLEVKVRLYMLEEAYGDRFFIRCSKSVLLNLLQVDSISPALNGRFTAHMKNGEKLIISRQYAGALKRAVMKGAAHEV